MAWSWPWVKNTWSSSDVKQWQYEARNAQNMYRRQFSQTDFDVFEGSTEHILLRAKILYALYSSPPKEGFSEQQQDHANDLKEKIVGLSGSRRAHVGFVYVVGKMDDVKFLEPVMRVGKGDLSDVYFVDRKGRVYENWKDWEKNNHLPKCLYCYPRNGVYRTEANNPSQVALECGTSPASDLKDRLFDVLDKASLVVSLVVVATFFTPLTPMVANSLIVSFGLYSAGRSAQTLVDKAQHGESLSDREAIACWVNIAATVLGLASDMAVESARMRLAGNETVSRAARLGIRALQFGKLGVNAIGTINHMAILLDKLENESLTALDVVQFTTSLFFFTNIHIHPDDVRRILEEAQMEIGGRRSSAFTEQEVNTLRGLQRSMAAGRSEEDTSVTTRRIRRVRNAEELWRSLSDISDSRSSASL